MEYMDKLKDPRWQKKRLKVFNRDGWRCKKCGDKRNTLHVHHRFYHHTEDPWECDDGTLITLCQDCHEEETAQYDQYSKAMVSILKRKFFSDDVYKIGDGLFNVEILGDSKTTSDVICFALKNKKIMGLLYKKYLKYLEYRKGKNADNKPAT